MAPLGRAGPSRLALDPRSLPRERHITTHRRRRFVDYRLSRSGRRIGPLIGAVVVQGPGERELREVPLWLLARNQAESVSRANAIPIQLEAWDID